MFKNMDVTEWEEKFIETLEDEDGATFEEAEDRCNKWTSDNAFAYDNDPEDEADDEIISQG